MKIVILYGTETGNAEMLAIDLARYLGNTHRVTTRNMADAGSDIFDSSAFFVLVSSTYGEGDLPASAQPFREKLVEANPVLKDIRYAVFGLGDSQYPETYNKGSAILDNLMGSFGARRVGARGLHDASGAVLAEDAAIEWLTETLSTCEVG